MTVVIRRQSLYQRAHDEMARRIVSGEWKPGSAIPNEVEIAREFGLSSGTIRKALDMLEAERLVVRQQGRGTFVADTSRNYMAAYRRLRTGDDKPVVAQITVRAIQQAPATADEMRVMQVEPGSLVWRIERLYEEAGTFMMLEFAHLPAALYPGDRLLEDGAFDVAVGAQRYGILLGKVSERIALEPPPISIADRLPSGKQFVKLDRVVRTLDGRVAEWRVAWCDMQGKSYASEYF